MSASQRLCFVWLHNSWGIIFFGGTYTALEGTDEETLEDLASLVTVADVFECLGGVLAADVEKDFFTTGVLVYEAWRAQRWSAEALGWAEKAVVVVELFLRSSTCGKRRTGAVVDLVVDDHVEVFLREVLVPLISRLTDLDTNASDAEDYLGGVLGHIAEGEFLRHCGRRRSGINWREVRWRSGVCNNKGECVVVLRVPAGVWHDYDCQRASGRTFVYVGFNWRRCALRLPVMQPTRPIIRPRRWSPALGKTTRLAMQQ